MNSIDPWGWIQLLLQQEYDGDKTVYTPYLLIILKINDMLPFIDFRVK